MFVRRESGVWPASPLALTLAMVAVRSFAMAVNRLADLPIDAKNPRTLMRPLVTGEIGVFETRVFIVACALVFVGACALLNPLCLALSPVALVWSGLYSYTKRFTPLCHLVLGLGLSLAPIGAYIAVTGTFALLPLIYSFLVLTWVSGFDIIYSLQDDQFDRETGLYSIPAVMSRGKALAVSTALHLVSVVLVIVAGITGGAGWLYWSGAVIFIGMLIYQHLIVKPSDLSRVNMAFGTTNGIAGVIFGLAVVLDLLIL